MLPIVKFYKSITGIDIAFVDGGTGADTIIQVAAQFVIAGFVAGDSIVVSGSTSNDGTYTIVSVVAGTITLATGLLTAEIAGDSVTIDSEATTIYDFGNCDAGGYKPDSTGLIIHLWNDKEIAGSDNMTSVRLSVRDADGNEDDVWTKQCWIEVKSNGGTATVDDAMTTFTKIGLNHELTLGDIQSGKYRRLYIRVHAPTDAIEGNITFQLRVKYQDPSNDLVQVGITAFATGGQANAVAITKDIAEISICATAGDSVKLPSAAAGLEVIVINHGVAATDVFPNTDDAINEAAPNAAKSLGVNASMLCIAYDATNWECLTLGR